MSTTPPVSTSRLYHAESVAEAVRLLVGPGNVTELRALEAITPADRWPCTQSGYFDDPDKLAEALRGIKSAKGIYIIPNTVDPALLARAANRIRKTPKGESTQDTDIVRRRWLLVDTDAQRPSGISASDAEHDSAIARTRLIYQYLRDCDWPEPIAADSGNGAHLMYPIDLPPDDGELVQRCLITLADRFDDDAVKVDTAVYNPARIWKLYGTLACKGDSTPDRPHRMAHILSRPDEPRVVDADLLAALASETPTATTQAAWRGNGEAFDVGAFIERHSLDVDGPHDWRGAQGIGNQWTLRTSPMCEHHDGAVFLLQHARGAITATCHHNSCSWTWQDLRERLEPARTRPISAARKTERADAWRPNLVCMANVAPRPVDWLWPGRIPLGRISLLVGMPGAGKSYLTCDIASRVSTGTPWPDGSDCQRGAVIFITAEDDPHDTVRPRLDAHYADVSRIHLLQGSISEPEPGKTVEVMFCLTDVDTLEQAISQVGECRLIVIDPVGSFLGGRIDAHRDNEVRSVLAPVAKIAERHGAAVLVVAHRRKSAGTVADDTAIGSRAFTGIARAVWHLSRAPDDKQRRLLLPGKCNLAPESKGLAFSIGGGPARVSWEHDPVDITADDALAAEYDRKRGPEANAKQEAMDWLTSTLADGPRPAADLLDGWIQGQGGSKSTLYRAKAVMDVEAYRPANPGPWFWRTPQTAKGKKLEYLDNLPKNAEKTPLSEAPDPHIAKFPLLGNVAADGGDWGEV